MDPLKTGKIISEKRKANGLTQSELAEKLHVSDKAVSKWERGICFPDISLLIPLTEILNISLYELMKGDMMKKDEVETILKDTVSYSNDELKRKKKRTLITSLIIIIIIILVSLTLIFFVTQNSRISIITHEDTIYSIDNYVDMDYKNMISLEDEKIENILMMLPLNWSERTFDINSKGINIEYKNTYKKIKRAYKDEYYVKEAMIHIPTVLFTTISDIDEVKFVFSDYCYTAHKKELLKVYEISDFNELYDNKSWKNKVEEKLKDKKRVNDIFSSVFKRSSVSKVND